MDDQYNSYKCTSGHKLKWTGDDNSFTMKDKCDKCAKNYHIDKGAFIRWACEICKTFFCQMCFSVLNKFICPDGHELEFHKDYLMGQFTVCDGCFDVKNNEPADYYIDEPCNLGFCIKCVGVNPEIED
jgi:hypothetical protein